MDNATTVTAPKAARKPRFQVGAVLLLVWANFRFLFPFLIGSGIMDGLTMLYITAAIFLAVTLLTNKRGVLLTVGFGVFAFAELLDFILYYANFFRYMSARGLLFYAFPELILVFLLAALLMLVICERGKEGSALQNLRRTFSIVAIACMGTYTFLSFLSTFVGGLGGMSSIVSLLFLTAPFMSALWLITMRTVFPYKKDPAPQRISVTAEAAAPAEEPVPVAASPKAPAQGVGLSLTPPPARTLTPAAPKTAEQKRVFCPHCGKPQSVPAATASVFCMHCGQRINL